MMKPTNIGLSAVAGVNAANGRAGKVQPVFLFAFGMVMGVGVCGLFLLRPWLDRHTAIPSPPADSLRGGGIPDSPTDSVAPRDADRGSEQGVRTGQNDALPEPVPPAPGPDFRLCALTGRGSEVESAGIEEPGNGSTYLVRLGGLTAGGWQFIRGDMNTETAVFAKDGHEHTLRLEAGSRRLAAMDVKGEGTVDVPTGTGNQEKKRGGAEPAFENRVVEMDGVGPVEIQLDEAHPAWVRVKAEKSSFVLRREIADNILKIGRLGEQEQAWMLLSHPALVEVRPGEDAIRAALAAETELNGMINNPPTNTPSIEELNQLIKERGEPWLPPDP